MGGGKGPTECTSVDSVHVSRLDEERTRFLTVGDKNFLRYRIDEREWYQLRVCTLNTLLQTERVLDNGHGSCTLYEFLYRQLSTFRPSFTPSVALSVTELSST